jgi:hypothetical protein
MAFAVEQLTTSVMDSALSFDATMEKHAPRYAGRAHVGETSGTHTGLVRHNGRRLEQHPRCIMRGLKSTKCRGELGISHSLTMNILTPSGGLSTQRNTSHNCLSALCRDESIEERMNELSRTCKGWKMRTHKGSVSENDAPGHECRATDS